jgi:murein DD-endopeptidase MepM/ murein hydrolase activator NlpD
MKRIFFALAALAIVMSALAPQAFAADRPIKWVDFNVPYSALKKAAALDIQLHGEAENPENSGEAAAAGMIEMLAYLAATNGNDFKNYSDKQLDDYAARLRAGETAEEIAGGLKLYAFYREAYEAALGGAIGEYEIEVPDGDGKKWERRYGVKLFSPSAKGFEYSHYDDFGNRRSYGFSRPHLGNDLMGQVGTPIVAVEGGTIEALGWNQYGGWRVGIRSLDTKRYYYYAHLRRGFPYRKDLSVGDEVRAGDVIGYLGRTGYSLKEDVNNIKTPHLHFGLQLIFDESQKENDKGEIWIDVYQLVRFLDRYRSETRKNQETKDYYRIYETRELKKGD